MLTFLNGYKTHLVALLAALGTFLHSLGIITPEQWQTLLGILGPLALMTLRWGVAKVETRVEQVQDTVLVQAATVQQVDAKLARVEQTVAHVSPPVFGARPPHRTP